MCDVLCYDKVFRTRYIGINEVHLNFSDLFRENLKKIFPKKKQQKQKPASVSKEKAGAARCSAGANSKIRNVSLVKKNNSRRPKRKRSESNWSIDQFQVPAVHGKTRFHDLNLPVELMHAICDLGFKYCTPIQTQILAHTLQGKDAIGKAQTGTGKTAAFLITVITLLLRIRPISPRYLGEPRVIIIAPTRELAIQIGKDAKALTRYTTFNTAVLVGGIDYEKQQQQLEKDFVDIVIATPGRLLDFISRNIIHPDLTETLVLDEADRMLDMGFIPQVRQVVLAAPKAGDRQTLLFSATFNDDVLRLAKAWTWNPVKVETEPENIVTKSVSQKIYIASSREKYKILCNLIQRKKLKRVIVFANRRYETRKLAERLQRDGIKSGFISGDLPQKKRVSMLEDFKSGKIHVLVATDVAGRGIHIKEVTHVINYNLPEEPDNYIHRVGRTGRAGEQGVSIGFACEDDAFLIETLESKLGQKLSVEYPPKDLL